MTTREEPDVKALAVACWVLGWTCAGLIPASLFAAKAGDARTARIELTTGVIGATALAVAGALLW